MQIYHATRPSPSCT